jgi:hypothetical protein
MIGQEAGTVRLGFWAVLLFSVFAWAPTTYPGYWESLEGFVPVFNAVQPSAIAGVAVKADLWRGTGSAAFLPAQPLILMGVAPVVAVRAAFAVAILLGGLGVYVWLRDRWGDRAAGLAGMLYMLWPPLLATVYVRGSLGDAMILGLLPLAFAGAAIFSEHRSPSAVAVIAVSLLWMWRTQAGLAAAATLLLLAYVLLVERSWLTAIVVGLSAAAGFTTLLPFWSIQAESSISFFDHFVYPHQLLFGEWNVAPSVVGWQDRYPFQLGFAAIAFGIVALWLWLNKPHAWRGTVLARLFVFAGAGALLLIVLSLPVSSPLWRLSGANRLFTYPWQIMLLAGPLLAVLAGSLPVTMPHLGKPLLWTVLIGLVVLGSLSYLTTEFTQVEPPDSPVALFGDGPHVALLDAAVTEDATEREAELEVTWQALQPLPFDYNVFFQAHASASEGTEVVAQLDVQPLEGERPATTWRPGEIFTDTYKLDISQAGGVAAGSETGLRYHFGYYDWRDGSRLPVDSGIDDKLILYGE